MRLVLAVALVACSSPAKPPAPIPPRVAVLPPDAAVAHPDAAAPDAPPPLPPETCPASVTEAKGACRSTLTCTYGTTTCACERPEHCGGAAPRREEEDSPDRFWSCAAPPPAVRADGCPGASPRVGTACRLGPKQVCTYDGCTCFDSFSCIDHAWAAGDRKCFK